MLFPYDYFHQKSKDKREGGLVRIPKDESLWPKEWKIVEYKTTDRAPRITLPAHQETSREFLDVLLKRKSPRNFSGRKLTLKQLGSLLRLSYGEWEGKPGGRRCVPSGGYRYPLELYVLAWDIEGLSPGVYHYAVKEHSLEHYAWEPFSKEDLPGLVSYDFVATGSALVVMTSIFSRSTAKYASRGYRYALLEAGHVGQTMCLSAGYLDVQARPLGGTNDEAIERLINVDGSYESLVYAISIG